ncbi:hypothetical protein Acear_0630 [Acetohalobium arabaticum DSM 5501]|uniref:Uncharacterized protein n=1 Tax=Acetohalobium arabaticum (strain ATCC 49924 / DSM 5501 / Z-7288) TaxID=574087 RepID=D9QVB3_ACEAZ|nr:hypothetical protein Acear_0630 [Acetohalobium arabaticum DSM 5501]
MKKISQIKNRSEKLKNIIALSIAFFSIIMPVVIFSVSTVFIFFIIIKILV